MFREYDLRQSFQKVQQEIIKFPTTLKHALDFSINAFGTRFFREALPPLLAGAAISDAAIYIFNLDILPPTASIYPGLPEVMINIPGYIDKLASQLSTIDPMAATVYVASEVVLTSIAYYKTALSLNIHYSTK